MRLNQGLRYLKELGPLYNLIIIASVAIFGTAFLFQIIQGKIEVWGPTAVAIGFLITVNQQRSDRVYLKNTFPDIFRIVISIEYLAIIAVLLIPLLIGLHLLPALALVLSALLIAQISWQPKGKKIGTINIPISMKHFEWKLGLQVVWHAFLFFNLISITLGWQHAAVSFVSIIILGTMGACFNLECEDQNTLQLFARNNKNWTFLKWINQLKLTILFTLPAAAAGVIYNPEFWYLPLLAWVISAITILIGIVMKYALFSPGTALENNSGFILFALISCVIPFFLPVTFFLLIRYYPRISVRTKPYLN
ncbi:MAG: hypothetical protein ACI959_002045 [Limisphaerales bacterium]|jgi:hypothetical protein